MNGPLRYTGGSALKGQNDNFYDLLKWAEGMRQAGEALKDIIENLEGQAWRESQPAVEAWDATVESWDAAVGWLMKDSQIS